MTAKVQQSILRQAGDVHMRCVECNGTCTYEAPSKIANAIHKHREWLTSCEEIGLYIPDDRATDYHKVVYGTPEVERPQPMVPSTHAPAPAEKAPNLACTPMDTGKTNAMNEETPKSTCTEASIDLSMFQ